MNMITPNSINTASYLRNSVIALVLVFSTLGVFPIIADAYSGDGSCCDTGWYNTADVYTPTASVVDTGWYNTADVYTPATPSADTGWYNTADVYTPATSNPGTVTVESVPTYTAYDVYASTPYYYDYGGYP